MILYYIIPVEDMDKLFNLGEICGLIRGILYIRCSLLGNGSPFFSTVEFSNSIKTEQRNYFLQKRSDDTGEDTA